MYFFSELKACISENTVSSSQSWYSSSENRKMVLWCWYAQFQITKITELSILTSVSFSKFSFSGLKPFKGVTWKISNVILSIWCYIERQNCLMSFSTNSFLLSASSVLHKHGLLLYQAGSTWTPMCPVLRQTDPQFASQALPSTHVFFSISWSQSPVESYQTTTSIFLFIGCFSPLSLLL